jgi:hypothetical protein
MLLHEALRFVLIGLASWAWTADEPANGIVITMTPTNHNNLVNERMVIFLSFLSGFREFLDIWAAAGKRCGDLILYLLADSAPTGVR